jgi:hypothetical protein
MASREAMNMGSRSSSVISELRSVISLLGQTTDSAFQRITSGISRASSFGGQTSNVSSTLVAPNPVFNAPQITYMTETGSGIVSSGPSTSSSLVARGAANLSSYAAQTGAATVYQPELGSPGGGGGSGGGKGNIFNTGGTSGAGGGGTGSYMGLSNIPVVGSAIAAGYALYNTASNLTPSTSDALEAQLLQQRASFYMGTGQGGIKAVQASQKSVAQAAMLSGDNPQMDVMRAQIAAQSMGLGSGVNNLLTSAANVSNLMPGLGVEGAMRATGSMQQASSVNMLRGIGIQLRGADGTLKGPDAVIEEVWQKICRDYKQAYGSAKNGGKPPLNEVQIALQPGNSLDSMLNQYFGGDPMLKQLVANGLLFKAQGGSSFNAKGEGIMQSEVDRLGGTTSAMLSYTSTAAAGQGLLTAAEGSAATGFVGANAVVSKYYNDAATGLVQVLAGIKGFTDTVLTAFGGSPASAMVGVTGAGAISGAEGTLKSILGFINNPVGAATSALTDLFSGFATSLFKADGGPVSANTPYVVGEVGPELFIPSSNGTIVPNNKLGAEANTYNFTINAPSGNTQDLVAEIKKVLIQIETSKKVSES